jgi:polysaccharide deacetylase 2 family uncharacterized protein YibQ
VTDRSFSLVALLLIAAVAAWWMLRPAHHHAHRYRVAAVPTVAATAEPESAATTTPPPAMAEATVEPTQTPETPPTSEASTTPAAAQSSSPGGPQLALIVDDCGQWLDTERGFIALGIPLTLSVLPDVPYTGEIAKEASQAGKGVMLHLPMETVSGLNPGPGKVTTEMSDAQIESQVESDLAQVPLADGVNNHEGSKASADERVMKVVISTLAQHHDLFFIDSRTSAESVGDQTARTLGVPTAARDVFLDNRADVAYSEAQLLQAAALAQRNGSAIAIGHPRPTTLAAVKALIPRLQAEGIHFVLARALVEPSSP